MKYSAFPPQYDRQYNSVEKLFEDGFCFNKHSDWKEEEEYRLVTYDFPECLSIKHSIAFIVLGAKMSPDNYQELVNIINDPKNASYSQFDEDTFVKINPGPGNIFVQGLRLTQKLPQLKFVSDRDSCKCQD